MSSPTIPLGRFPLRVAAVVVATTALGSCQASSASRPPAPAAPPVVDLVMREYRYEPGIGSATIPAGRVSFALRNVGDQGHQPTLLVLPDDVPPIQEQLKGSNRRNVPTLASNSGIPPKVTGALAVDLTAGQRYAFVCFVKTSDDQDHSRMGMAWEFRAGPAGATATRTSATKPPP